MMVERGTGYFLLGSGVTPSFKVTKTVGLRGLIKRFSEVSEKEVQETSWRGAGGVPQIQTSPQEWEIKGVDWDFSALLSGVARC